MDLFQGATSSGEPEAPVPTPARPVAAPRGRRLPDGAPDEVVVAPAPDTCPSWGGILREVSRSKATRVDWRRGHFFTVRVERPNFACDRCTKVETAPEPASFALPRTIVGNGLVAQIVVDKFADNIPLNRQATRFEREGLELSPSTLGDVVRNVAGLLSRIVLAMKDEQRGGRWLQADDTGLPVLDGDAGKTVAGRLWVYANEMNVIWDSTVTKHGARPHAPAAGPPPTSTSSTPKRRARRSLKRPSP